MEQLEIIIVSLFGGAWLVLLTVVLVLCCQLAGLRKRVTDLEAAPRMRVQRLTMETEPNHAFHNPAISPDEELSKRGYSMYVPEDVESGRGTERQTGGEFVEELSRELESRQQRQMAPPFLLQGIQANKLKSRDNSTGNHDNAARNHVNAAGNHGNQVNSNGNPVGNQGHLYGNLSYPVGNQSKLYGNNSNPAANQGNHDKQSNYSHQRTRQSDTNPNFIY